MESLAIASKYKNLEIRFLKYHPSGSLSVKLKTAEDLMVKGKNSIYKSKFRYE